MRAAEKRPAWMDNASCRGMDPELFFPERGESTALAREVCAGCPVVTQCLHFALDISAKQGVWGNTTERQRRRIRRERSAA